MQPSHNRRYRQGPGTHSAARLALGVLVLAAAGAVRAGPPFLTDDPEPIEYKHSEAYAFATMDRTADGTAAQVPAFEFNTSPLPDVHLHIVVPLALNLPRDGSSSYGAGDVELGFKYRFIHESDDLPQVGIFPMAELSTGDADRGLGNGRTWWKLPLWLQKSWGPWTTYGGGGYVINNAAGARHYPFGGWLLQRDVGKTLTLGGELFAQGAVVQGGRATAIANFGGFYTVPIRCGDCKLLFTAGHSVAGERHTVAYLGLYWEFGPESEHSE